MNEKKSENRFYFLQNNMIFQFSFSFFILRAEKEEEDPPHSRQTRKISSDPHSFG